MDTVEDSDCNDCALPVDTGECRCDVPDWFSVDLAINIRLKSTARNALSDSLDVLNFEHTSTKDYEFNVVDHNVRLLGDPNYVP